jgi:hypothetical protein
MNAVREQTGLNGFGGVVIPSMAVKEDAEVGESCVAVRLQ